MSEPKPLVPRPTPPYVVPGRNGVLEALKAKKPIEKILILFGVKGQAIEKIRQLAKQASIPVVEANRQKFRELAADATTQGVLALLPSKEFSTIDDIKNWAAENNEPPFFLVLDEIEDPHNLGALIRTAECAGVHGVIIPKHGGATFGPTVERTSAGASSHMRVAKVTNVVTTLEELKKEGYWIVGADDEGDRIYTEVDYTGKIVVVIGNEGRGIRRLVKDHCDFVVRIPVYGKVSSLNASVAGAIVLYEAAKMRKRPAAS